MEYGLQTKRKSKVFGNILVTTISEIVFYMHHIIGQRTNHLMQTKMVAAKRFVQLGHEIEAIIDSAYLSFDFSGRNSTGQYVATQQTEYLSADLRHISK